MVVVTLADLAFRYRQFLIAVLGAGVVMAMALLLAGLATGFGTETSRTVGAVGADRWVLTDNSDGRIGSVAVFPQSDAALITRDPGVTRAAPLALLPEQVLHSGTTVTTVNMLGAQVGEMGTPTPTSGHPLSGPGQIVVDSRTGVAVGSVVRIGTANFHVVGEVDQRSFLGGIPMVYLTLRDTQVLALGGRPLVTAVVTQGTPSTVPAGLEVLTNQQVEKGTLDTLGPGISSINNSKFLMWAIAGIIIAALLYVSALQRVRDFAVLKALGSTSSALLGSLAMESVIVALAAACFGAIICNFMSGIFQQTVDIPTSAFLTLPIVAVVVGLLASLVALRRATGADPAAAFGG